MNRYRLVWPNEQSTTYRNHVTLDPRPVEIIAAYFTYCTLNEGPNPVALQFWESEQQEHPLYTFFEFPCYIECRPYVPANVQE
jgi:hypothetical protein